DDVQVPARSAVETRYALALHREHGARLGSRGDLRGDAAGARYLDRDVRPERRLRERHPGARDELVALSLELRVGLHVHVDVEIACLGSGRPGHPLPGNAELLPGVDAGGNAAGGLASLL